MAAPSDMAEPSNVREKSGRSLVASLLALLAITAIGVAGGISATWLVEASRPVARQDKASGPSAMRAPEIGKGLVAKPIPVVVTKLAGDRKSWVRAEFVVLFPQEHAVSDVTTAEIAQDTLAFLQTVAPSQIEGLNGLRYLREDLEERIGHRTGGKSQGLLFRSFILE
jgi:hypothetical protein